MCEEPFVSYESIIGYSLKERKKIAKYTPKYTPNIDIWTLVRYYYY